MYRGVLFIPYKVTAFQERWPSECKSVLSAGLLKEAIRKGYRGFASHPKALADWLQEKRSQPA
eukprot:465513-Pelagomonas_calceolata.AAC.2